MKIRKTLINTIMLLAFATSSVKLSKLDEGLNIAKEVKSKIKFSKSEIEQIKSGEILQQEVMKRIFYIQDIEAPSSLVFDIIINVNSFAKWKHPIIVRTNSLRLPSSSSSDLSLPFDSMLSFVKLKLFNSLMEMEYFTIDYYDAETLQFVSLLDKTKKTNALMNHFANYWVLEPMSSNTTRIYHALELEIVASWIPLVNRAISHHVLLGSMLWIKRESQKLWIEQKKELLERRINNPITKLKSFFNQLLKRNNQTNKDINNLNAANSTILFDTNTEEKLVHTTIHQQSQRPKKPIGILRIFLVSLVYILILFNIILCLERISL